MYPLVCFYRFVPSRYAQWSCSTPTMIFTLSRISSMDAPAIARTMAADWLMVVLGYMASEVSWGVAGERLDTHTHTHTEVEGHIHKGKEGHRRPRSSQWQGINYQHMLPLEVHEGHDLCFSLSLMLQRVCVCMCVRACVSQCGRSSVRSCACTTYSRSCAP